MDEQAWRTFFFLNQDMFSTPKLKKKYKCDAFYVDLGKSSKLLVADTAYWFGLFSHQRDTYLWKGMLKIELVDDEQALLASLVKKGGNNAS